MSILSQSSPDAICNDAVICRCLQVCESTLCDAIAVCGLSTVKEVCTTTGAGSGCTACHARLRELIARSRQEAGAW